jgi:hypothetical protein
MKSESEPGFDPESAISPPQSLHLHGWTDRAVVGVALAAFAAGVGQFGLVAALGDVARAFGRVAPSATIADQVGLSGCRAQSSASGWPSSGWRRWAACPLSGWPTATAAAP